MLGEFEYLILSAAVRLENNAYGAAIRQQIETATKRRCSIGPSTQLLIAWKTKA